MPTIDDICISLARIIRFAGQTEHPVTVATHSILVAKIIDPHFTLAALLHDSVEAVVGDRIGTWKTDRESDIEDALYKSICESIINESDAIPEQWKSHPTITYALFSDDAMREVERADYIAVCCEAVVAGHADPTAFQRQPLALVETAETLLDIHAEGGFDYIKSDLKISIQNAISDLITTIECDEKQAALNGATMFTQPIEADR